MPHNPVTWFEIPATDLPRAQAFYEHVLGVTFQPDTVDGHAMALFPWADGQAGASGALVTGNSYVPGRTGARVYFGVDDIDATLARAVAHGGLVHYPVTAIGAHGFVAEFIDTEGNLIALHAPQRR
jgi:hypothetical protein